MLYFFLFCLCGNYLTSILYKKDYSDAGIKVFPNTQGIDLTKRWIAIYTVALFIFSLTPYFYGYQSPAYLIFTSFFGIVFSVLAFIGLLKKNDELDDRKWAKYYFWGSLAYLPAILSALIIFK